MREKIGARREREREEGEREDRSEMRVRKKIGERRG